MRKIGERIILSFVIIREKEKKRNMNRMIPLKKQSKRAQRAQHSQRRATWGEINPVTRTTENKKAYNRKKSPRWYNDDSTGVLLLCA